MEEAQEEGVNRSILTVCEDAKVPRRTFYYWLANDPCFAEAWESVWRKAINRHLPSIVAAMVCKARKGDVAAARLLADMAGALTHQVDITSAGEKMLAVAVYLPRVDDLETESGTAGEVSPKPGV